MEKGKTGWTLTEIAEIVGGELQGPPSLRVARCASSDSSDSEGITFAESARYLREAENSSVAAVIVTHDAGECAKPCIRVERPREAFFKLLTLSFRPLPINLGIHPTAVVSDSAKVSPSASIGAFVVLEAGAVICAGARIHPFCYIGEDCVVGESVVLHPHVVLIQGVSVGARSLIHSGAILGADGFGFGWDGKRRIKIPQVGTVVLGEDTEIGANTTIDRATSGETKIGRGTKLDNQIQVGHNVVIGEDTVIAAQTGISGSVNIGNRVVMGGNVAVKDHVTIGDDTVFGGRSGVAGDILEPGEYFGAPAMPKREAIRNLLLQPKLYEMYATIRAMEKRIAELEKR